MILIKKKPPIFFLATIVCFWVISLTPLVSVARTSLATVPSLFIGSIIGIILFLRRRRLEWLYTCILVVLIEQILVLGASFVDEMILMIFFMGSYFSKRHSKGIIGDIKAPLICFVCVLAVSALVNNVPFEVAIAALRSYIQYALLYFILRIMWLNKEEILQIIELLLYCGTFIGIISIVNLFNRNVSLTGRAEGVLSNPNAMAGFLVFVLSYVWFFSTSNIKIYRSAQAKLRIVGLPAFMAFVSSGSRSMIVGLAIGLGGAIFFSFGQLNQKMKYILLLITLASLGFYLTGGQLFERFKLLGRPDYLNAETNIRVYYTEKGLYLFNKFPIIGVGPGRYGGSVATIYPSPVYQKYNIISPYEWVRLHAADVFYPHLLAELGALGFIFFILLVGYQVFKWYILLLTGKIRWTPIGAASASAMVGIIIASLGGLYFELHITSILYWISFYILQWEINDQRLNIVLRTGKHI